jgi:hypothetical protein
MPAKRTTAVAEAKPAARKRSTTTAAKPGTRRRKPTHGQIAKRAYYISLQDGGTDEFGNWLRAEHELTAA